MADLARALQTPVPATQPAPQTPPAAPARESRANLPGPTDTQRAAKAERDRLRRKEKRAADLKAAKAAEKKAAAPKKKRKAKKKVAAAPVSHILGKRGVKKARGRGRPPGSKNKPKAGLAVALVPAPGVLPRVPAKALQGELSSALATMRAIELQLAKHTPADRAAIIAALA